MALFTYQSPHSGLSFSRIDGGPDLVARMMGQEYTVALLDTPPSSARRDELEQAGCTQDTPYLGLGASSLGEELAALCGPCDARVPGKYQERQVFCFAFQGEVLVASCEAGKYGSFWLVRSDRLDPDGHAMLPPHVDRFWPDFIELLMEARGQRLRDDEVALLFGETSGPYCRRVAQAMAKVIPEAESNGVRKPRL